MATDIDKRRKQLFDLNSRAWDGEIGDVGKLDSSLKKNTAFIKKVRTSLNGENTANILKDIASVSLEKYLSEVIAAITEGLLKCVKNDDIVSAMEVVSALHQRFEAKFTPFLLVNFLHGIANPKGRTEKDDTTRVSRQKVLIRLITEFYLIGIFRTIQDCAKDDLPEFSARRYSKNISEPIVLTSLREIMNYDLKSGVSIPVVSTFLKRFSYIIWDSDNTILSSEFRDLLRQMFTLYSDAIFETTSDLNKTLHKLKIKNKKASVRTGRILEDIAQELDETEKQFEKFKSFSEYLSELLGVPMIDLTDTHDNTASDSIVTEVVTNKNSEEDLGVWESLEMKQFYEKLPELDVLIPSEALDNSISGVNSGEDTHKGDQMSDFLAKLESCSGAKDVDDLTYEYWTCNLNNKASHRRLYKFFLETPEINKLKYYTRFLAINQKPLSKLVEELVDYLDKGFRSQIYHNRLSFKNITFFCEAIKFRLVPTHVIFHKIRTLIISITASNNIDILGVFFELIGRFLLNDAEYKELMEEMLSLLKAKRKNDKLTLNDKMAIDNLLLTVKPPQTKIVRAPKRSALSNESQFLRILLRKELNSSNWEQILLLIKKFDFNDEATMSSLKSAFTKPEKINYENIIYLTKILALLKKNRFLMIYTIDTMVEKIQRGLEINNYRLNRSRIAHVKYFAEMFNHRMVSLGFIIDLLFKILMTGHPNNNPSPGVISENDLPDDYFRIHLVTTLVQSLDKKQAGASQKKKLEVFFHYFEYYCFLKDQPIPRDTEFKLYHMFEHFDPKYERVKSLREAIEVVQAIAQKRNVATDEDDDDDDDDDDDELDKLDEDQIREAGEVEQEQEEEDPEAKIAKISMDQVEAEYERRLRDEEEKKYEDELEREFQKMVLESLESRKLDKSTRLNAPIPSKSLLLTKPANGTSTSAPMSKGIPFTLVTKNGKKNTSHQVSLPSNTKFAASILQEEERQRSQKERIKNIVLRMED